jgi:hypothetical protein
MYDNPDLHALWRDPTANGYIRWADESLEKKPAAGLP